MLFGNKKKGSNLTSIPETSGGQLRLIGDRGSGKTGYLASLAYWPNASTESPVDSVIPVGQESQELVKKARDILEQGLQFEPTRLDRDVDDMKDYALSINLKKKLGRQVQLNISCKDYSGEFFSDLLYKAGDPLLNDYVEDCCFANGLLVLVDGTAHRKDSEYAIGMEKLLMELDRGQLDTKQRRIALVLSKCEQSELWVSRHQPKQLAARRFRQLSQKLEVWSAQGGGSVNYFAASAFGVLGKQFPEPNSQQIRRSRDGTTSIIKRPKLWRPFGLVSPIYWLCTGERHSQLDRD